MAKASVPGRTKTRLVPPLTFEEAAALNTVFLKDAFANIAEASRSTPIRGFAAYGSIGEEAFFENLAETRPGLIPAAFPNFGECLFAGIEGMLAAGCSSACVLNADTPDLPTEYLVRIARELAGGRDRVVIGPADDGGYYILGHLEAASAPVRRYRLEHGAGVRPDARTRGGTRSRGRHLADVERYRRCANASALREPR